MQARRFQRSRAYVLVMAMFFLVIIVALAAGLYSMLTSSIDVASNDQASTRAMAAAESGLQYMKYELGRASTLVTMTGSSASWLAPLTTKLNANLAADGVPSGRQALYSLASSSITVPATGSITLKDGATFRSTIVPTGGTTGLLLQVTGQVTDAQGHLLAQRTIWVTLIAHPGAPVDTGGFPMVAGGTISIGGNAGIDGYDAATGRNNNLVGVPLQPWGAGEPSVVALEPPAVDFTGTTPPVLPNVDVSFLNGMKSSLQRCDTANSTGEQPITNAYIPAGKNLTFNRPVTITGILYVEWPNNLTFNESMTLNGVIVYQRKAAAVAAGVPGASGASTITLAKDMSIANDAGSSKAALDTAQATLNLTDSQRASVATLTNWSILAPDTDLSFDNGNSSTKRLGGSLHIHNLNQTSGQGSASASLILNKANIICDGDVTMRGNRVYWILPPGDLVSNSNLKRNYLMSANNAYYEYAP